MTKKLTDSVVVNGITLTPAAIEMISRMQRTPNVTTFEYIEDIIDLLMEDYDVDNAATRLDMVATMRELGKCIRILSCITDTEIINTLAFRVDDDPEQ